jgi:hypothetical protein
MDQSLLYIRQIDCVSDQIFVIEINHEYRHICEIHEKSPAKIKAHTVRMYMQKCTARDFFILIDEFPPYCVCMAD